MPLTALSVPVLIAAAFIFSLFFHGAQDVTYAPALLLLLVAGLAVSFPALRKGVIVPRHVCVWLTLALWLYVSLNLIWTSVPFVSLVTWLNLSALPLVLMMLVCAPDRDILIRNVAIAIISITCIAALYNLWQFFGIGMDRASGILPNPNNMAALINLSLLPAAAFWIAGPARTRIPAAIVTILLFTALMTTGSRGGMLCAFAGLITMAIILRHPIPRSWKQAGLLLATAVGIFITFHVLTPSTLYERIAVFGTPGDDFSSLERLAIWQGAWAMLKDHLLTGTGLGTFYLYYPSYRLEDDHLSFGHWTHFDALQLGAETGILAIVLFYAVIAAWFWRGISGLRRLSTDDPKRVAIAGCMAALLALALHAHIEFQFYIMANLIVAATLMAALHNLTSDDSTAIVLEKRERLIWGASLSLVAFLAGAMTLSAAGGVWYLNKANTALNRGNLDGFVSAIGTARLISPHSYVDDDVQLAGFYIDLLAQTGGQMTIDDRKTTYNDTLSLLNEAAAANPVWGDIDHKRAKLHARIGVDVQPNSDILVIEAWTNALKKNPMHAHAREEFARYQMKRGRIDDAYAIVTDGLKYPMTPTAHTILTGLKAQMEPLRAAREQYRTQPATPTKDTTP